MPCLGAHSQSFPSAFENRLPAAEHGHVKVADVKGDERILGDSDFVLETLKQSEEYLERKYRIRSQGYDLEKIADWVAAVLDIESEQVFSPGKIRLTVRARSLLCYWAVRECGMTMASLAGRLGLSITSVSQSAARGEKIAKENGFELFTKSNV
jgi:chromosomal replication initiation ATPase DnaA